METQFSELTLAGSDKLILTSPSPDPRGGVHMVWQVKKERSCFSQGGYYDG